MPFSRPTLRALIDRISSDLNARLPGADSRLRRSVLYVLARSMALATHGLYGFGAFLSRQILPDVSEGDYLRRQLSIWGVSVPAAQKATGTATFTGTEGALVPSGAELQRGDEVLYVTTASGLISGGSVSLAVEAVVAAEDGNADAGTILELTSPVSGIDSSPVTVDAPGLEGGTDPEDDEQQRARLLERIRTPPQGGADADYQAWAKLVTGVTRVFVYPNLSGAGTVGVTFTMDGRTDPVPLAADVSAVDAIIQDRRPVTADVSVFAPTALPVAYDVSPVPDTPEVRAAIEAELRALHQRDAEPGQTLPLSRIREAISIATGETSHVLNAPVADVVPSSQTELPTFGSVAWT